MTANHARLATLTGLLLMIAALLLPAPSAWTSFVAVPLAALLLTGIKPPRKWGGWVAVAMVPYFCIPLGEMIANPAARISSALIAGLALLVFYLAMDYVRRAGIDLRA